MAAAPGSDERDRQQSFSVGPPGAGKQATKQALEEACDDHRRRTNPRARLVAHGRTRWCMQGESVGSCPYYASRKASTHAQIIAVPYRQREPYTPNANVFWPAALHCCVAGMHGARASMLSVQPVCVT